MVRAFAHESTSQCSVAVIATVSIEQFLAPNSRPLDRHRGRAVTVSGIR